MPYFIYLYVADISLTILIKPSSLLCVKHDASSWGTWKNGKVLEWFLLQSAGKEAF